MTRRSRACALGEPAGVLQLLDRHGRDCERVADRLGVPRHAVPDVGPAGAPFEVIPVLRREALARGGAVVPRAAHARMRRRARNGAVLPGTNRAHRRLAAPAPDSATHAPRGRARARACRSRRRGAPRRCKRSARGRHEGAPPHARVAPVRCYVRSTLSHDSAHAASAVIAAVTSRRPSSPSSLPTAS
jgi:hypothetical protein